MRGGLFPECSPERRDPTLERDLREVAEGIRTLDEVGRAGAQALTGANLRCWSRHPDTDAMIAPDAVNRLPVDILPA